MRRAKFCIQAEAGVALLTREPGVWYSVWDGRHPPSALARAFLPRRPRYQSQSLEKAEEWIANYRLAEAAAERFNNDR